MKHALMMICIGLWLVAPRDTAATSALEIAPWPFESGIKQFAADKNGNIFGIGTAMTAGGRSDAVLAKWAPGVSTSSLHRMELAEQNVTLKTLDHLLKRLKCSLTDVFPNRSR